MDSGLSSAGKFIKKTTAIGSPIQHPPLYEAGPSLCGSPSVALQWSAPNIEDTSRVLDLKVPELVSPPAFPSPPQGQKIPKLV